MTSYSTENRRCRIVWTGRFYFVAFEFLNKYVEQFYYNLVGSSVLHTFRLIWIYVAKKENIKIKNGKVNFKRNNPIEQ